MGDKIVVMKDGNVRQTNTPLNLYHHPTNKFVAGFIGSPAMNFMDGTITENKGLLFKERGTKLALRVPKEYHAVLKPYRGKEVWLGIRPEHIGDARDAKAKGHARCVAKVDIVEPMGNEIFVYYTTGSATQYVARIIANVEPEAGKEMEFAFDMSNAHFFDKTTEKVI